jgi:hypothetical protein
LNTLEPARIESPLSFTIRITNTGDSWIGILPLSDVYSTTYLAYGWKGQYADPASDDCSDDGVIEWTDLTASVGEDLAPGASFTVVVTFTAKSDTTDPFLPPDGETVNTAIVQDALADPDGAGPLQAEIWVAPQQGSDSVQIIAPTGLTVTSLDGVAMPDCVLVTWETASEVDILGFNVLRRSPGETFQTVTTGILLAKRAGSHRGAQYAFRDEDAVAGREYDYVLEVVQSDGRVERQGLVSVEARWWLPLPLVM